MTDKTREAIAETTNKLEELKSKERVLIEEQSRRKWDMQREREELFWEKRRLKAKLGNLRKNRNYLTIAEVTDKYGQLHRVLQRRNDPHAPLRYDNSPWGEDRDTNFSDALKWLARHSEHINNELEVVRALIILTAKH